MKYYIDTEFLEGTQKEGFLISLFRKEKKPTIDLISIGLISEDNREYYIETIKQLQEYPKQTNEHNALADAYWNKELHEFLNKI